MKSFCVYWQRKSQTQPKKRSSPNKASRTAKKKCSGYVTKLQPRKRQATDMLGSLAYEKAVKIIDVVDAEVDNGGITIGLKWNNGEVTNDGICEVYKDKKTHGLLKDFVGNETHDEELQEALDRALEVLNGNYPEKGRKKNRLSNRSLVEVPWGEIKQSEKVESVKHHKFDKKGNILLFCVWDNGDMLYNGISGIFQDF